MADIRVGSMKFAVFDSCSILSSGSCSIIDDDTAVRRLGVDLRRCDEIALLFAFNVSVSKLDHGFLFRSKFDHGSSLLSRLVVRIE